MPYKKKIVLRGRFATPEDVEAQIAKEESPKPLNLDYSARALRRETKGGSRISGGAKVLVGKIISTRTVGRKTEIVVREMVKSEEPAPMKGHFREKGFIAAPKPKLKVRAKDEGRSTKKLTSGIE